MSESEKLGLLGNTSIKITLVFDLQKHNKDKTSVKDSGWIAQRSRSLMAFTTIKYNTSVLL